MRFEPESIDGANAGLEFAREFLDPIAEANPWISRADLWSEYPVISLQSPSFLCSGNGSSSGR